MGAQARPKYSEKRQVRNRYIIAYDGFTGRPGQRKYHRYTVKCLECGTIHEGVREDSISQSGIKCVKCPRPKKRGPYNGSRTTRLGVADSYMNEFRKILPVVELARKNWKAPSGEFTRQRLEPKD